MAKRRVSGMLMSVAAEVNSFVPPAKAVMGFVLKPSMTVGRCGTIVQIEVVRVAMNSVD